MKKAFIHTFGCKMNEYDSQRMAQLLDKGGYKLVQKAEEANLILLNSCSVRHSPENKIYSFLGRAKKLKKKNESLVIGVGGCVAQQEGDNILKIANFLSRCSANSPPVPRIFDVSFWYFANTFFTQN